MSPFLNADSSRYEIPPEELAALPTPCLVLFLDAVADNVRSVLAAVDNDPSRWRPHVKTAKIASTLQILVRAGVRNFKCATPREARLLCRVLERDSRPGDVLYAQHSTPPALAALARLAAAHPRVRLSVLCEDPDQVADVPGGIGIFLDLNPGMNRTGVPFDETDRILSVITRAGSRLRGVHCYEGHVVGRGLERRRREAFEIYARLVRLLGDLRDAGTPVDELVTSGTPTFRLALEHQALAEAAAVHRVSPGTVVYHDLRSEEEIEELDLQPAALVLARVVSRPAPDIVTLDAGSKAVAAEVGDPCAWVLGRPDLVPLRPSEEHMPLRAANRLPRRGAAFLLVPRHVCPTVNLAEQAVLVRDGRIQGIEPVAARAHDVASAESP